MRIVTGLLFFFAQGLLLGWLLFGDKKFLHTVVLAGAEGTDAEPEAEPETEVEAEAEPEPEQPAYKRSWRTAPAFRGAVVAMCSLLAGVAGYLSSAHIATNYEPWKLGVALLGASAAMLADFYIYIIPNRFLLYTCGARLLIFVAELIGRRPDWKESILNSLIGLALAFVILLLFSLATRQGIGMGDVKLMSTLGFLGGIYAVLNTLVYSLLLCVVVSVVLLVGKKKGLKDKIPFGPFIYFGYLLTLCMGAF